jgi:hypothetical protein
MGFEKALNSTSGTGGEIIKIASNHRNLRK